MELKQLAAYLPYELKAIDIRTKEIRTVTWLHFTYDLKSVGMNHLLCEGLIISKHLPILRPMSDLTKEIEVNGFKFIPIIKLFTRYNENAYIINTIEQKDGLHKMEISLDQAQSIIGTFCYNDSCDSFMYIEFGKYQRVANQYQMFEKLFEWHFDIFGLIGVGLAIDINTL